MTLEEAIRNMFGGLLRSGGHSPGGEACILEAVNVAEGRAWGDSPEAARSLRICIRTVRSRILRARQTLRDQSPELSALTS